MESNIKITFWLNKTKKNQKNLVPIYLRVVRDKDYFIKATGIYILVSDWDKKGMRIKGASTQTSTNNATLDAMRLKVLQISNQLSIQSKPFNIHTIKQMLEGEETSQITILKVYNEQIAEMVKLKGRDFSPSTIIKYKNTLLRIKQFMKHKYRRSDMYLYELNYMFMSNFISFLKLKFDNSTTTCYKHYQRFTRVINLAIRKGYLEKYPFGDFKLKLPKKTIQYLTQPEIDRIAKADFKVERLNIIRDVFVFCIYTGLAYAEVESLTPDNITVGMDGEPWLNIHRKKTDKDYQIPLLPMSLEILAKYKNNPICIKRKKCLPVPSNVKYNAYLKEIGDIAGIPKTKPLVTHLARKTFACTVALSNGMSIGVVSKILGHNSIKVTLDSYATVIDELMLSNVKELKEKMIARGHKEPDAEIKKSINQDQNPIFKLSDLSMN